MESQRDSSPISDGVPVPVSNKRKRLSFSDPTIWPTPQAQHPYLTGNFAPIQTTTDLTPCSYTGTIPAVLAGGEYVRNGSNPVSNENLGRAAHWFDGDGMLSGVSFALDETTGDIRPEFVNRFVLTDLYLSAITSPRLRVPILPSIATLVDPLASAFHVLLKILRTVVLVLLSYLPGSQQKIKKISVANTNVVYHDGRALATCESGPPMRIQLPGLDTVGWYNGAWADGEPPGVKTVDERAKGQQHERILGQDGGLIGFMREWTTAHPKVDPRSKEMLMFHSSFAPPYVQYSIIPQTNTPQDNLHTSSKLLNAPVPGVQGAKMMHDFGASLTHTIIMDLPLSLDPINQLKGLPPVSYDATKPSRFGIFPRRHPEQTKWFETEASCIFHTANTWDDVDTDGHPTAINMLACRLTSATLIFAAGNIAPPVPRPTRTIFTKERYMPFFSKYDVDSEQTIYEQSALLESPSDEKTPLIIRPSSQGETARLDDEAFSGDQCRLYYYNFALHSADPRRNIINHQWALSAIPFEFPSVRSDLEMSAARYVYGCSTSTTTSFGSALGKATKIDALVKVDATTLIKRGLANPPKSVTGVVDGRTMEEVLESTDRNDPIRVFRMPPGWFAQEPRFVPRSTSSDREDDGYLVFYAYDEAQLLPSGDVPLDNSSNRSKSEFWIVNAKNMRTVVARIHLPQRVPYGLHGSWFSAEQIAQQRPVGRLRTRAVTESQGDSRKGVWMNIRRKVEEFLG